LDALRKSPATLAGILLGKICDRKISLDGLSLADGMQYFAVPDGYVLDSAERLVIAFGDGSLQ
jgi:hypothetical protein